MSVAWQTTVALNAQKALVMADREQVGRVAAVASIINSQTADGPARLRCRKEDDGRKRHALVDTDGPVPERIPQASRTADCGGRLQDFVAHSKCGGSTVHKRAAALIKRAKSFGGRYRGAGLVKVAPIF